DVEHRVALHEGNGGFGCFAGGGVRLRARDLVRVNGQNSLLALAHRAAEIKRLLEGHPDRRAVALSHRGHPEGEDVHATIGDAVMPERKRDAAFHVARAPWPLPWAHAFLQFAYDLVGDGLIDVGAHGALTRSGAADGARNRRKWKACAWA